MISKQLLLSLICLALVSATTASAFPFTDDSLASSFFNSLETSSTVDFKIASISTALGNRFISGSADGGVEIFNNVQISSYSDEIPSKGSVSAFIKGSTLEGGSSTFGAICTKPLPTFESSTGKLETIDSSQYSQGLYQESSFFDFTSMDGDIISFSKFMSYHSSFTV